MKTRNIKPQDRCSTPSHSGASVDDMDAALQCVQIAFDNAAQSLADQGVIEILAKAFQANPLEAELRFKNILYSLGCKLLRGIFESFGDHGPFLEVEGKKYRKVAPSTGRARTLFGMVEFDRPRYRPANGSGDCFVPAEHLLGLTEGGQTQAAASLAMMLLSSLTPRECVDVLKRVTGEAPAISTLAGLAAKAGQCLEECSEEVMPELRKQEKLPENAAFFQTSLDGTMMRMNAEKNGDDVTEEAGWREASCGVLSIFDNGGNKLQSRYLGRLPEKGKLTLKEQLRQEVSHIRSQNPDLKLVATADGAKDNWTFLKSLNPDLTVLDFWHAAEYLKRAADAFFGADDEASMKWFKAKRHSLRTDPEGVSKVINALRYLLRKGRGKEEIRKALGYFRNNRRRMNYYQVAEDGYPIGSGDVEAANKVLVNQRLKRSGQSWGRDGGQGVLSYRALLKSDRFDRAWSLVVPQLNRSKRNWDPGKTAANDNWQIHIAA